MPFSDTYLNKRVLLTGHTGFKGAWLAEWLLALGAKVTGLSLIPPTTPALFDQIHLSERLDHQIGDILNFELLCSLIESIRPDFIFHLAAQSLVRLSYKNPVLTYSVNVIGTINLLEAVRLSKLPCTVIAVTTDKAYENREWVHSYREEDPMGGYDPYSSSKGMAELAIAAYRRSYFSSQEQLVRLASARAGNVIGGGDWAEDRIIPDCVRSLQANQTINVRNRLSTRPWQHVLEPLSGYLQLGAEIHKAIHASPSRLRSLCSGFNFGPALSSNQPVGDLVQEVLKNWPGKWLDCSDPNQHHEAKLLSLATDKAFHFLNWRPVWTFEETVRETISWYRSAQSASSNPVQLLQNQIAKFTSDANRQGLAWTR